MRGDRVAGAEYRLPKERQPVRLQLVDGRQLEGDVFLRPAIEAGPPAQEVVDFLNEPEDFFPLGLSKGDVLLVSKAAVRAARYDESQEGTPPPGQITPPPSPGVGAWVEVVGTAGARYRGWLEFVLPRARRRLSDALNRRESQFFKIIGGKEIWCVNRDWVAFVRPLEQKGP